MFFGVNGVFKCNKIVVHFKLTLEVIFVVLSKYLNCAADKTIEAGHTTISNCSYYLINGPTYYFLVQTFYKSRVQRDIDICHLTKAFFCLINILINLYIYLSATAQFENIQYYVVSLEDKKILSLISCFAASRPILILNNLLNKTVISPK